MPVEIGRLLTAMLTPFKSDGSVDYEAAEKLAVLLVADGSDGVVVSGTTGESPALSDDEKIELLKAIKKAIPRHSVVAGTGSNDTHHSVKLSERAMKAGADALLAVVPYYNKPPQEGMYQHFKAISEIGPTIMYNIQGRTAINMSAATWTRSASSARASRSISGCGAVMTAGRCRCSRSAATASSASSHTSPGD